MQYRVKNRVRIRLANKHDLKKHLKALVKKYGKGNVLLEEAFKFDFKWKCV